jgi:tRNA threonylcarbamoyladenosine biosynthesis protein TsaE
VPESFLADEKSTENLGATLASQTPLGGTWLLKGQLGAGKTTWTRGFVEGLGGDSEQVSSPTYAVLHRYDTPSGRVLHLDLYRSGSSGVWTLGLEDSINNKDRLIVEWPGESGPWVTDWVCSLELTIILGGRKAIWNIQ